MINYDLNEIFREIERKKIDLSVYGRVTKKDDYDRYEVTVSLSFAVNPTGRGPRVSVDGVGETMYSALGSAYDQLMNVSETLETRYVPNPPNTTGNGDDIPF